MLKTITKLGVAALFALGVSTSQAQTYVPNTTFGGLGLGSNEFNYPYGVNVTPDGKIFVADYYNHRISVWTQSGNAFGNLTTFGNGTSGSDLDQFYQPTGVTVGTDDKIFVADFNNHRISVWTHSGNIFGNLTTFGGQGFGSNEFSFPYGVSISPDGKIWVADQSNNRISVWTQSGNTFGNLTTFGSNGSGLDQFSAPTGVTVGSDGKIFVADYSNHRISVWTQSGNTFGNLTTFGSNGSGLNQFSYPSGITLSPDGKIFVADYNNQRISVWTQSGNTFGNLTTFGGQGSGLNQFIDPIDVSIAPDGKILVSDNGNHRISVWEKELKPFITEWDLTQIFEPSTDRNDQIVFGVGTTTGIVSYQWETIPATISGTGTFTGTVASITGLPADAKIRLSINPQNFNRFYTWYFNPETNEERFFDNPRKLINVAQWGDVAWSDMFAAFYYCENMEMTATDVPNLSGVTDMGYMFYEARKFNGTIGGWNVSNVKFMNSMFQYAKAFNQPIGNWNTAKVENMNSMFGDAEAFNQPIGDWNTAKVESMNSMFYLATAFNQPISNWNISNVVDMEGIFYLTTSFNQSLGAWGPLLNPDVNMYSMFVDGSLSVANYEATLQGFASGTVTGRSFYADDLKYCNKASRDVLLGRNWTIIGDAMQTPTTITTQPISVATCAGLDATFNVSATGITPLTYLWNTGATTTSINANTPQNFQVTVTGGCGMAISTTVGLTTITNTSIATQPISAISCAGSNVAFALSATGSNLSYTWSNGLSSTNTMTTSIAGTYTVTVTGACGMPQISSSATLQVYDLTKILTQPVGATLCGQALMEVSAVGTNLTYTWSNGNIGTTSFFTSISDNYTVTVSGLCGTEISNNVNYSKLEPFNVVITPFGKEIIAGQTATLVASATGSNISYLWSTGATTNSVSGLVGGDYSVTVAGSCGSNTYSPSVEEIPYPTITGLIFNGNPADGGLVTINGLGIVASKGTSLTINGIVLGDNILDIDNNQMLVTIPSGIIQNNTVVTLLVSNEVDEEALFSSLTSIYPINVNQIIPTTSGITLSGIPADMATISGTGFVNGATITVNGVVLTNITVIDGNIIVATLPSGINTSTISVSVQNPNQVAGIPISISNPINISVQVASVSGITTNGNVTSITSSVTITINGTGFVQGASITVNGVALSVVSVTSTSMIVTLPAGVITTSGAVNVQVSNPNQVESAVVSIVPTEVSNPTSIDSNVSISKSLKIYPNPVTNGEQFFVEIGEGSIDNVLMIYNIQGVLVHSQSIAASITKVASTLPSGIYLLKIGLLTKKLVIE
jgi:surface protein